MGLENIVSVQITRETSAPSQAGFGVPLFLSTHAVFAERVRYYSSTDSVADDFLLSSDEYKAATAAFGQELKPNQIAIGRRTADVAQVSTVTVATVVNTFLYGVTINGTLVTYLSDGTATAAEITAGLVAAINANGTLSPIVTAVDGVGNFTVTADVAGDSFTITVSANLTVALTVASKDITDSIQAIIDESDGWYLITIQSRAVRDIKKVAAFIEAKMKLFLACSEDADVITNSTTDIASFLQDNNYFRTGYLWNGDQDKFPEMGWAGLLLPNNPDSRGGHPTWAFKTLAGIATDLLTDNQINFLKDKNANYYILKAGLSITLDGKMAGDEWIDIMRGVDWLTARIQERVFAKLVNLPKIPYTDAGVGVIEAELRAQLDAGIGVGFLVESPAYTVSVPAVSTVSPIDRANRLLPDVQFSATLAGAIHQVQISGTVSV